MQILIVKLGAIGDVIRTTSVLPGLHDKCRPVEIDWLTAQKAKEILLNNPLIRKIFTWEERSELGAYDLIISLEDDLEVCEAIAHLKTGKIIGTFLNRGKIDYTPSAWFDMSLVSKYGLKVANQLKIKNSKTFQEHLAELVGVKVSSYVFKLTADEIEDGKQLVKELGVGNSEKLVGINTGAGGRWKYKALGIDKTIDLVNGIKNELGMASIILGGAKEQERNQLIAKVTGMPNAGVHSLRHFAAIINRCQKIVTSDSLAMHFAIAMKKPLVVFFGPTAPAEIELYGLGRKIYPKMDCLVCYLKDCDRRPTCMDELLVSDLLTALKRV